LYGTHATVFTTYKEFDFRLFPLNQPSKTIKWLLFAFIVLCSAAPKAIAQQNTSQADTTSQEVVRNIRFVGNKNVNSNTLETLIRTHTNREFLGIPRFTPWYFIWKVTKKFGEPPALLNRNVVGKDNERIKTYYESLGYLSARVDTSIVEFQKNKVEVSFLIDEGPASHLRTLAFSGMPNFDNPEKLQSFYDDSKLVRNKVNDTTFTVDRRFTYDELTTERNHIINFLKDNGYAAVQRDSVVALVRKDSSNQQQLDVLFRINPGKIYHFGDVSISLSGPEDDIHYNQSDTLEGPPFTEDGKLILLQKESESQTRFSLLTDQILFKPGAVFNNSLYLRTINEFQNLGMMTVRQFSLSRDGSQPDYSRSDLPVNFDLQTRPKHQLSTELFGMERYGFGAGAGITYTNNNLFGKAENLQVNLNGNFEYVSSKTLKDFNLTDSTKISSEATVFQSYQARIDYTVPRLNFPFARLDKSLLFSNARTRYSLIYGQSNQINFNINNDIRFNVSYEVNHNNNLTSFLDLVELDWLDTTPSTQFNRLLEQQYGKDSFELKRIKEDFRPQFSTIIRYTLRDNQTDLIKRNYGHFADYTIAVGGNFPYLLDRLVVTPNKLEGNLPSLFNISGNSLSYSRFFKFSADYRRYIPIGKNATFAYRGFAGFAHPYGQSRTIPLNRRFFAGGSNDIRGWAPYRLGPGSIPSDNVTINGGEIKLAAFTEVRQLLLRDVLSANWIGAWFNDMGNVWYGPRVKFGNQVSESLLDQGKFYFNRFYKQIAMSSGLGIRLDWDYVVLRLDLSMRIHDLQEGWLKNRGVYFSFGIGHSF